MADDFHALMQAAMGKATGNVSLRLWTPQGASVAFVRQVAPAIEELTGRGAQVNPLTADYPTATWGRESRDYHVCINVPPREVGDEMLAGRVSLVEGDGAARAGADQGDLDRRPAAFDSRSAARSRITRARPSSQTASSRGSRRARTGDFSSATFKLGRAVQLAAESGNDGTMKLLQAVVEVDDPATGTIRLKPRHHRARRDVARLALDGDRAGWIWPDMTVACPRGHESQATDYCDQCGAPIAGGPRAGATQVLPALDEIDTSPAAPARAVPGLRPPSAQATTGTARAAGSTSSGRRRPPDAWEADRHRRPCPVRSARGRRHVFSD